MKFIKNLLPFMGMGALLLTASCSSEDVPEQPVAGEGVTFTVNLPAELQSRAAFGSGLDAVNLTCAVYEHGKKEPLIINGENNTLTATFTNLKTTVTMNLPRGKAYDIVFWAQNPDAPYTFSATDHNFNINYAAVNSYDEKYDAFCWVEKNFAITTATTKTITLYRPFAQLNIGTMDTSDAKTFKLDYSQSQVTVNGIYSQFDFLEGAEDVQGTVTGEAADVTFAMSNIPNTNLAEGQAPEQFPVQIENKTIDYMAMLYVLVPTQKMITQVTFDVKDPSYEAFTFENVPFQRNYRTNIYGNLLTAPAEFNVVIDPIFNTPDYNVVVSDVAALDAAFNAEGETANITLSGDIANAGVLEVPAGKTVTLNLNGHNLGNVCLKAIKAGSNLIINGEGILSGSNGTDQNAVVKVRDGNVTLNGGSYVGGTDTNNECNSTIYVMGTGKVIINGGTYSGVKYKDGKYYVLNIRNDKTGTIELCGGKYIDFNPVADLTDGSKIFLGEGFKSVNIPGTTDYEVVAE